MATKRAAGTATKAAPVKKASAASSRSGTKKQAAPAKKAPSKTPAKAAASTGARKAPAATKAPAKPAVPVQSDRSGGRRAARHGSRSFRTKLTTRRLGQR